jgi:hypothetical protein
MDLSPIEKGTLVLGYFTILVVILILFLVRRGIPRPAVFRIVQASVAVFFISCLASFEIAGRVVRNGDESLATYLPPVIPVVVFVAWSLRRMRKE